MSDQPPPPFGTPPPASPPPGGGTPPPGSPPPSFGSPTPGPPSSSPPPSYGAPQPAPPAGGQPPYGSGQPPGYGPPASPTNGLAIAALVCGILSLLCLGPFGLIAVPLGFVALGKAKQLGGTGKGMAIAGIITGIVGILIGIAFLVLVVFAADEVGDQIQQEIDEDCKREERTLRTALEAFNTQEGTYPSTEEELVTRGYLSNVSFNFDFSVSGESVTVSPTSQGLCD